MRTQKQIDLNKKSMFNHIALRTAKTLWGFGRSECNRVNILANMDSSNIYEW